MVSMRSSPAVPRRIALALVAGLAGCSDVPERAADQPRAQLDGGSAGSRPGSSDGGEAGRPPVREDAGDHTPDARAPVRDGGASSPDAAGPDDPAFQRPDGGAEYTPEPGACGFDQPAFCDAFEQGPRQGGRSGELDPARWSVLRAGPSDHPDFGAAFTVGPTLLPACRADLPRTVLPDSDVLICDPVDAVPTRHLLTAAAAQNYGLSTYRIRQPFDFAGRTGTIKLDVDLSNNGLGGWPAIVIAQDPSPAPSFDWEERGSGPRNGLAIELSGGWCNTPKTLEVGLYTFRDYVQTAMRPSFDCETPHTTTQRDHLNHVEIYLSRDRLEVWASEPSPDGRTFPNFQRLLAVDLDLPFARGYVSLVVRNHATMKYWVGSAWTARWDNVGFDGPIATGLREHSVPDSLTVTHGLDGCMVGGECKWRGEVIAANPGDDSVCTPENNCSFPGEGRNTGYVIPNPDEPPVKLTIPDVDTSGATRARLALAATYPWFEWNGVNMPPTAMNLRYRLNGGAWHDRFVTAEEANAFTDFSPEIGGAGHGAGLLNQIIELDLAELHAGDNQLELHGAGTWTGSYRIGVVGLDLLLDTGS